ncbi:MAG: SMC-Scp complex subunit ScpB [bacterium]
MDNQKIKAIIEALVFASPEPVTVKKITDILEEKEATVKEAIFGLQNDLILRGIELIFVAGGWRLQTRPEFSEWIKKLKPAKKINLTKPSLITLSIIAYKQPVTKAEIEVIRGVSSEGPIEHLMKLMLVEIAGQKKAPGNPFLYRTTKKFLSLLGLPDISALPKIENA